MKNFTAIFLLSLVLCACDEHYDTSQWKDEVSTFKPNKITSEDFEFFVREDVKKYVQERMPSDFGHVDKPTGFISISILSYSSVSHAQDKLIVESLLNIDDKDGYYDHYEAQEDTLYYYSRLVHGDESETIVKFYISKAEVAKEIARQKDN